MMQLVIFRLVHTALIASEGPTREFHIIGVAGMHVGYATASAQTIRAQKEMVIIDLAFVEVVVLFFQIGIVSDIIVKTLHRILVGHFYRYVKTGVYVDAVELLFIVEPIDAFSINVQGSSIMAGNINCLRSVFDAVKCMDRQCSRFVTCNLKLETGIPMKILVEKRNLVFATYSTTLKHRRQPVSGCLLVNA